MAPNPPRFPTCHRRIPLACYGTLKR